MTKEEINNLAEFVKGGYCTFTKEQAIEALTSLDKDGKNLKRKEDFIADLQKTSKRCCERKAGFSRKRKMVYLSR